MADEPQAPYQKALNNASPPIMPTGVGQSMQVADMLRHASWLWNGHPGRNKRKDQIAEQAKQWHPASERNGLLERLVKRVGANTSLMPDDIPYLEQYLHPNVDVLPRTDERPTQATPQDMVYRKLARYTNNGPNPDDNGPNFDGLGHHTQSDGDGYRSAYDVWDFNTKAGLVDEQPDSALDTFAKFILKRMGKPFAVYERFPHDKQ